MTEKAKGVGRQQQDATEVYNIMQNVIAAVKRVIEIYNTRRLHEKLGYKTPAAYREEMAKAA